MSSIFHSEEVTIDGAGEGIIRFPPVPTFQRWRIDRISVSMTGGSSANLGAEARFYKNDSIGANFIDGTNTPWNDVYGGALELIPSDQLVVVFTSGGVGEIGTVSIQGVREDSY